MEAQETSPEVVAGFGAFALLATPTLEVIDEVVAVPVGQVEARGRSEADYLLASALQADPDEADEEVEEEDEDDEDED